MTDTYLGNPQAAWLEERRAPFVAFGRPWDEPGAAHPWVDVDGAAGTELATATSSTGPRADRLDRLAQGLPHRRGPALGLEPGHARRGLPTTGLASRVEDTVASRPRGQRAYCSTRPADGVRLRLRHPRHGRAPHARRRGLLAGRDIAVVGFDDSQVAQVVPPA